MKKQRFLGAAAVLLAAVLAGCTPVPSGGQASVTAASGRGSHWSSWRSDQRKYTQADVDLALSFRTEGYEKQTVAEFNKKVLDWENEDAYHKTEESLQRLYASLPEDDANGGFIFRTLFNTWRECEKKHYNACSHNSSPWYDGWAKWETNGDVFGDQVLLAGAYADFSFNYKITDESKLTVGERDAILRGVETGMEEFLGRQDSKALGREESMKKALEGELKRLLKALDTPLSWDGELELDYSWMQPFGDYDKTAAVSEGGTGALEDWSAADTYTKEQYELAVRGLRPDGWEGMSIGEFNRMVHKVLEGGDGGEEAEKLLMAYEMVRASLPESDPSYGFFENTVQWSRDEYDARAREVFTGRTADPEITEYCYAELQEDVFGDQVTVGSAEAEYSFTYRILDEKQLTVKERDGFLLAVKQGAEEFLNQAAKENSGELTKEKFRAGLEAAGKAASSDKIGFTGCIVTSCTSYR